MKQEKSNLDEFFAAARGEEPVISEENVRDLLSKQSLMQQSTSLFTTKGLLMTSALGLTAAGVIALSVGIFSSNDAPRTQQATRSHISVADVLPQPVANSPRNLDMAKPETAITKEPQAPPAPLIPPTPPSPPIPPKAIEQVKVVPVDESKFARLGIEREADGGIAFFMKTLRHKYEKYILPLTTWGVMIPNKSVAEDELPVSVKLTPVLITDSRGNRRMVFMSDSNSTVSMNHSFNINKNANGTTYKEINTTMLAPHGDSAKMKIISIQKEEQVDNEVSSSEVDGHAIVQNKFHEVIDSNAMHEIEQTLRSVTDQEQVEKVMDKLQLLKKYNPKEKFEVVIGEDSAQINKIRKQADMNIRVIKILQTNEKKSDTSHPTDTISYRFADTPEIEIPGKVNVIVKPMRNPQGPDINHILINGESLSDMVNAEMKHFDKLVPVLVRTATTTTHNDHDNVDYDNGVIFWFKSSPELDDVLGQSTASVNTPSTVSSGNISNLSIFPNPAKSDATVRFTLGSQRSVSLTLYDILGKRIADLGSYSDLSAGDHEEKLFVGNIPPGIYLLAITTAEGEQKIERIVIDR